MKYAPGDESPGGAMPEAAQEEDEKQIQVGSYRPLAIAPKGNVKIIPEP